MVSPDFISSVTDAVLAEVTAWQERQLDPLYPVIFFEPTRVKIRYNGVVQNNTVHVALGVRINGQREVLGLWIEQTAGAKFWLKVFHDLKTRGEQDTLIAVVDGLSGLPAAIEAALSPTVVQMCIVHLLRNSLAYTSWMYRRAVAAALEAFAAEPWGQQYPTIASTWRRVWAQVLPFFVFPPAVRRVLYTTNAIESLHMQLRTIIMTWGPCRPTTRR